jgi:phosphate starvation-inducible PhoH-like protein
MSKQERTSRRNPKNVGAKTSTVRGSLQNDHFSLADIEPMTRNQVLVFESENHLVLHGQAGTGKTFLSLYLALDDIFKKEFSKLVIIRSAVPTRDMGFLPGNDKEKSEIYEAPYRDIFTELLGRGDAYNTLKAKNVVEFKTTSFIRGTTIRDSIILVDECQNMTMHELDSIITRIGDNCRVIFCGDFRQSDLKSNGLKEFFNILRSMQDFDFIEFDLEDIVRSGLVKEYLTAKGLYEQSRSK